MYSKTFVPGKKKSLVWEIPTTRYDNSVKEQISKEIAKEIVPFEWAVEIRIRNGWLVWTVSEHMCGVTWG